MTVTACYLYAIIDAPHAQFVVPENWGAGLQGQSLQVVIHKELAAVISYWPPSGNGTTPTATEDDVWQHEEIIEGLMEIGPTLPVRFGTILTSANQVQTLLVEREAIFRSDLVHLAGRVEMGLRVLWNPPTPNPIEEAAAEPIPSGRHYLQRQAAVLQQMDQIRSQGESLAQAVNARLAPFCVDVRMQILQTQRLLLSAAYLIERDSVETFQAQTGVLGQHYPELMCLTSGPWPAYHFVGNGGESNRL